MTTGRQQEALTVKTRKAVPALTGKKLFQEADNRCPFCSVSDVAVLEIHHLDEDPSNNQLGNLIVVCANCHAKITHGEISPSDVHTKKLQLTWMSQAVKRPTPKRPKQTVAVKDSTLNNSIVANNVTFAGKRSPRPHYPADSIGADTIKKGYIDYLIGRYFDYKKADASYGSYRPFNHAELRTTIARPFKAKTFYIHVARFDELCGYIMSRIDQTIQGKRNTKQGWPNYDSFDKYHAEQLGQHPPPVSPGTV